MSDIQQHDIDMDADHKARSYTLAILFLVYTFSFIDRQILVIIQESIKKDLGLSDLQLGILSGFSFALFYVTAGIPIARWADRTNRRNIIVGSLTIWSAMTAMSGLVGNYAQLVAARIGVGVGEAGCSPPAHSMISDMYPRDKRATALSKYSAGIYLGILLGYLLGGYINELYGWRMTFFVVGVPGILLAVLMFFTVKEPKRRVHVGQAANAPTMGEAIKIIMALKSFRYFSLGCAVSGFGSYGIGNFMPSYLFRSHEMSSGDIGVALALVTGVGGIIGTILGGYLADKFGKKDKRFYMWIPAISALISAPVFAFIYLSDNTSLILWLYPIPMIFTTMYLGPSISAAHMLVEPRMRAMISAVLFFVLNLIGLGLGPVTIGALSDYMQLSYGSDGLRYAMVLGLSTVFLQAYLFIKAAQFFPADLEKPKGK